MTFETKKIRKINWKKKQQQSFNLLKDFFNFFIKKSRSIILETPKKKHNFGFLLIIIMIIIFGYASYKVVTLAQSFSPKDIILSIFSQKIKTDEKNHTNFLLVGTGGGDHDGADLTDSIKVVSIDHDNKYITMISVPRDLWVKTEEFGGTRINQLFEFKKGQTDSEQIGMDFLSQKISEITGLDIHYNIKIDFESFKQAVDSLGCVHIDVPSAIYDPFYPKDGTYSYDPFKIEAGPQCIDGDTALKYARSRYTTAGGDFNRSERQALLIRAIKDSALSAGVLLNPKKLSNLYATFKDNIYMDLSWDELIYLAKISSKFASDKILSQTINDVPYDVGGFLYAPPRDDFKGASVLCPSYSMRKANCTDPESYTEIRQFIDFFSFNTEIFEKQMPLRLLNGTKINGIALDALYMLSRHGFEVTRYGNAINTDTDFTTVYVKPKFDKNGKQIEIKNLRADPFLQILENYLGYFQVADFVGSEYDSEDFRDSETKYIIVLGKDFSGFKNGRAEWFYYWN